MAKHWLVQWRGAQLHVPSVWHRAKQRRRTRDVTRWLPSGARRGLCGGGHGAGAPVAGSSGLMDTAKWRLNAFQLRKGPHAEAAPEDEGSLGRCRWPQLGDMRAGRCFATREAHVFTARFLEPGTQQVGTGSRVNMRTAWFLSPRTRKVARGSTFASAAQHTPSMMRNDSRRGECRLL